MSNINYKVWSVKEDNLLKKLVNGKMSYTEITKQFSNRSSNSCRLRAIRYLGLENKNYTHKLYSHSEKFWETPNPINCYWAGFSAADACLQIYPGGHTFGIELGRIDKIHLEQFRKDSNSNVLVVDINRPNRITSKIRINNCEQWHKDLKINFNVTPHKTKRLAPPNLTNKFLQFCYLIGYIDGDGCICLDKRNHFSISITSASTKIVEWIFDLTNEFKGIRNTKRKVNYKQRYVTLKICGDAAKNMFYYLKDFPVPKLDRKWNNPKVLNFINAHKN